MDLKQFDFPSVRGVDLLFPTFKTIPDLLIEAKSRGFYNGHTPYNDLFSRLFFNGGKLKFKQNIESAFREKAFPYLKAFMQSWEPKHEEKEAICALIMSELLEP